MEEMNLASSYNTRNIEGLLLILLQDWTKNKVSDLVNNITSIKELDKLLNSEWSLELFFTNIRDTPTESIKIWKSKIDNKDYFINIDTGLVNQSWFCEIVNLFEKDWKMIFQACDTDIDWLYAYYDFISGEIISKKSDRRIYWFC